MNSNFLNMWNELRTAIGSPGAVLVLSAIAALVVWLNWPRIRRAPGGVWLEQHILQPWIPRLPNSSFCVAIADLEDDLDYQTTRILVNALIEMPSVTVVRIRRTPPFAASIPKGTELDNHDWAKNILDRAGAQILIWGAAVTLDGATRVRIFVTHAADDRSAVSSIVCGFSEDLSLPSMFGEQVKEVLTAYLRARASQWALKGGHALTIDIEDSISQLTALVKTGKEKWGAETYAQMLESLGKCLANYAVIGGPPNSLDDAVANLRAAIIEFSEAGAHIAAAQAKSTLSLALSMSADMLQKKHLLPEAVTFAREAAANCEEIPFAHLKLNNLAIALFHHGQSPINKLILSEALDAFRSGLKKISRENYPHDWAMINHNTGCILTVLSRLDLELSTLNEAIPYFEEAAATWEATRQFRSAALAHLNLGRVFSEISAKAFDIGTSWDAIVECESALRFYSRSFQPNQFADAKACIARTRFGISLRHPETENLFGALAAIEDSLSVWQPDNHAGDWAESVSLFIQIQLILGERSKSEKERDKYWSDAALTGENALEELDRDCFPIQWAKILSNIGMIYLAQGQQPAGDAIDIEKAIDAFKKSSEIVTERSDPFGWHALQLNMSKAYMSLGRKSANREFIIEGLRLLELLDAVPRDANSWMDSKKIHQRIDEARSLLNSSELHNGSEFW